MFTTRRKSKLFFLLTVNRVFASFALFTVWLKANEICAIAHQKHKHTEYFMAFLQSVCAVHVYIHIDTVCAHVLYTIIYTYQYMHSLIYIIYIYIYIYIYIPVCAHVLYIIIYTYQYMHSLIYDIYI